MKAEAVAFLDATARDGLRSRALATLLVYTGVRISEALVATLADLQHDTGHRVLVVTRKGCKHAKIALRAAVVDAFRAYLGDPTAPETR
ncbi:tyrosine-type recombinase/integrase [Microbacterium sp. BWR-S6Y]|uniref:tyrosine-type recombinase/integrase n=1 Tax=Microbacterium sp. BWR-S6Y TaxID=3232073 RepID=UPI0035274480